MKKQLMAAGISATIGLAGIGAGVAHAATTDDSEDPMSSLVTAIASKFNVESSEVQEVFDEQRETMEAERNEKIASELAELVNDGSLTQAQADAINAKREELALTRQDSKDTFKDLTQDERKAKMTEERKSLESWASENDIDESYLRYVFGHGGNGPKGGPMESPEQ